MSAKSDLGRTGDDHRVTTTCSAEGVATVEWRTGAAMNAWTSETDVAYAAAVEQLDDDPSVRVLVIRGGGGHFCAGRDLRALRASAEHTSTRVLSHGIDRTRNVRKPVIAVVHGACAGVGLTLALLADVRFASPQAVFSTSFARRGLPAGHATAWLLSRCVGPARAAELLLSGRTFDGTEAERVGLLARAVDGGDLDDSVAAYAAELATTCSPRALGLIKQQLADEPGQSYPEALAEAAELATEAFGTEDFREGVVSYQERRPPRFPPLGPRVPREDRAHR